MTDKIFLDTNILVYLFDKSEKQKQDVIKNLIGEHIQKSKIFISVQVINEFISITSKKITFPILPDKQNKIIELLNELFLISPLYYKTTLNALKILGRYKLSFWDSLIVSSALENNCNILFTEDMQNGLVLDDNLEIVNPFK